MSPILSAAPSQLTVVPPVPVRTTHAVPPDLRGWCRAEIHQCIADAHALAAAHIAATGHVHPTLAAWIDTLQTDLDRRTAP